MRYSTIAYDDVYKCLYMCLARVDSNLGANKNGRFRRFPGCRSAISTCHHGGRRRRYEAAVRVRQVARRCARRPRRPRLHARPVDVDRPGVFGTSISDTTTAKIGPCVPSDWAWDCSPSGVAHAFGSPYNRPPTSLAHSTPVIRSVQAGGCHLLFAEIATFQFLFKCLCLPKLGHCPK